jgi:hypothetical protein
VNAGDQARTAARGATRNPWVTRGIRVGFVAYGLVHLMLGVLGLRLALGDRGENVSSTGALKELAQQPFGTALLWIIVVGMTVLVVWRIAEAVIGDEDEEGAKELGKRAASVAKAAIYGVLGFSAAKVATGSGGGGSSKKSMTATVMDWPAGQWLVALAGLGVIAYGAFQIYTGLSDKHAEKLAGEGRSGQAGNAYLLLGKIGYCAKGAALLAVGALFVWAGLTHEAGKSGGLDQALGRLLGQPFGPILVGAIGVGLACYGCFCFARARHLST